MIRACKGPNGEQGVCWQTDDGTMLTCHTVPLNMDEGAELDDLKAAAMRAAMRDGANDVSHGDPRMNRDG